MGEWSAVRRVGVLLVTGGVAFVLTACGDDDSAETTDDSAETSSVAPRDSVGGADAKQGCTAERVGGEITVAEYLETQSLDPVASLGGGLAGGMELAAIYDRLMTWNADRMEYEPRVAESLTANETFTVWTLRLRDGVSFGNGDPLTAAAVKRSMERYLDPESTSTWAASVANISSMRVVDEVTLRFRLRHSWPEFPYVLAGEPGSITNQAVIDSAGEEAFGRDPGGGGVGPYELQRWAPGEELVLRAKDDYWDGPVCIRSLRFVTVDAGGQGTLDAFNTGQFDVMFTRDPTVISQLDEASSFSNVMNMGEVLVLNHRVGEADPPTADVRVRRAIASAIDPTVIDERAYEGTGLPTAAVIHDRSRLDDGGEQPPSYDPELARRLVDEVKSDTGWDGSLRLTCASNATDVMLAAAGMLEAVGFTVGTDEVTLPGLIEQVSVNGDYDVACYGVSAGDTDAWVLLDRRLNSESEGNYLGYANPEMDAALAELRAAEFGSSEQTAALGEIQRLWTDTVPMVMTSASEEVVVWSPRVHGITSTTRTVALFAEAYVEDRDG